MVGITKYELETTRRLQERLTLTRTGRRWQRLFRLHEGELVSLLVVYPDVRDHVVAALTLLCEVGPEHGTEGPLDSETLSAATRVLDDLQRLGGFELRQQVAGVREELEIARGRVLAEALAVV